jgi:hypothetical protein
MGSQGNWGEHIGFVVTMAREATLFRVQGPSGVYYAVYEVEQQLLFTEANEKGARDHAAELGLTLSRERAVRHAELMHLTGRDAPAKPQSVAKPTPAPKSQPATMPLDVRLPRNLKQTGDELITTRSVGVSNPFASTSPLAESSSTPDDGSTPTDIRASDALAREVMNFKQTPKSSRRGNPFAGPSQKQ